MNTPQLPKDFSQVDNYHALYTFVKYMAESFTDINSVTENELKQIIHDETGMYESTIDRALSHIIDAVVEDNYVEEVHDEYEPEID